MKAFVVLAVVFSSAAFAADTQITFGHITSLSTGTSIHSIQSSKKVDSEGRRSAIGVVVTPGGLSLETAKIISKSPVSPGVHLETASTVSGGVASANAIGGNWDRPSYTFVDNGTVGSDCAIRMIDNVGDLPTWEYGGYMSLLGCITNSASCTPNSDHYSEEGSFNYAIMNGWTWCFRADKYSFYNGTASYIIDGDQTVSCFTCSI